MLPSFCFSMQLYKKLMAYDLRKWSISHGSGTCEFKVFFNSSKEGTYKTMGNYLCLRGFMGRARHAVSEKREGGKEWCVGTCESNRMKLSLRFIPLIKFGVHIIIFIVRYLSWYYFSSSCQKLSSSFVFAIGLPKLRIKIRMQVKVPYASMSTPLFLSIR